ncbi:MAG: hypothetical protein KF804_08710 [Burkholderiales bacterium]|jgi:poly(3-hydroxybutyrate) depolymerase|nr:hypothetical protein [Burkholderiales bacterium]
MRLFSRLAACVLCCAPALAAAELAPEFWDRPRSASAMLAQDAVRHAVAEYHARPAARLVIIHGGGQEAQLQAAELRAWLVALAIDGTRLFLRADPAARSLRIVIE